MYWKRKTISFEEDGHIVTLRGYRYEGHLHAPALQEILQGAVTEGETEFRGMEGWENLLDKGEGSNNQPSHELSKVLKQPLKHSLQGEDGAAALPLGLELDDPGPPSPKAVQSTKTEKHNGPFLCLEDKIDIKWAGIDRKLIRVEEALQGLHPQAQVPRPTLESTSMRNGAKGEIVSYRERR